MSKIIIPIRSDKLHKGHLELIEFGKTYGEVSISKQFKIEPKGNWIVKAQERIDKIGVPEELKPKVLGMYLNFLGYAYKQIMEHNETRYDHMILGPDVQHFYLKPLIQSIIRDGGLPPYKEIIFPEIEDNILIFPKTVKDEYGLRYRTTYPEYIQPYLDKLRNLNELEVFEKRVYDGEAFLGGRLEVISYLVPINKPSEGGGAYLWTEETFYE